MTHRTADDRPAPACEIDVDDVEVALGGLERPTGPSSCRLLLLLAGVPAVGKTAVARTLACRAPIVWLSTDLVRTRLVGTPSYDEVETDRVYRAATGAAVQLLAQGLAVCVDATLLRDPAGTSRAHHVDRLRAWCATNGVPVVAVHLTASRAVLEQRLRRRNQQPERQPGDRDRDDPSVLDLFDGRVPPAGAVEVDTDGRTVEEITSELLPVVDGRVDPRLAAAHLERRR